MNTGRAVLGVAFIALGTLLLLERAGVVDAGPVLAAWWPLLLLVGAGLQLAARPPRPVGATVLGVLGLVLLAVTTDAVPGSVLALVWPLGILTLGVWLLWRRGVPLAAGGTVDDRLDVTALFSGRRIVSTSRDFRGGEVTAVFGGVEIDLSGARLVDTAHLELVAVFGGIELTVPHGWRVTLDGPAILGGNENGAPAVTDPDAPTLRVHGTAVLGGIEIRAVTPSPAPAPARDPFARP